MTINIINIMVIFCTCTLYDKLMGYCVDDGHQYYNPFIFPSFFMKENKQKQKVIICNRKHYIFNFAFILTMF